jgi:hypothetical protein
VRARPNWTGLVLVTHVTRDPPRALTLHDPLGPPVEAGRRADKVPLPLKRDTALCLGLFQLLAAREVPVDQHRVRQGPPEPNRCSAGCSSGECGGKNSRWVRFVFPKLPDRQGMGNTPFAE